MGYRFVDHTAELQLELDGPTQAAVFEQAVLALADLLGGGTVRRGRLSTRDVVVEAADDPALLAAWLDELVFVAETEELLPRRVERLELGPTSVRASVAFVEGSPPHLVKGVTYHDLRLAREGETWHGRVVLDV